MTTIDEQLKDIKNNAFDDAEWASSLEHLAETQHARIQALEAEVQRQKHELQVKVYGMGVLIPAAPNDQTEALLRDLLVHCQTLYALNPEFVHRIQACLALKAPPASASPPAGSFDQRPCPRCGALVLFARGAGGFWHQIQYHDCNKEKTP